MWDVNSIPSYFPVPSSKLFFNYVGCKSTEDITTATKCPGYSLTMWDVNFTFRIRKGRQKGYSLTMWDVNTLISAVSPQARFGHFLTIWDVNLSPIAVRFFKRICYFLTMWDIN